MRPVRRSLPAASGWDLGDFCGCSSVRLPADLTGQVVELCQVPWLRGLERCLPFALIGKKGLQYGRAVEELWQGASGFHLI
jgi:hypothetical protein